MDEQSNCRYLLPLLNLLSEKKQPDHQSVLYVHSSLHFDLIMFFIPVIKAHKRMLAGLNRN